MQRSPSRITIATVFVASSLAACGGSTSSPSHCDVSVPAKRTEMADGKRYCVAGQVFTTETKYEDAKRRLVGCEEELLEGETRLKCNGAVLSFGGPILRLGYIEKAPETKTVACDVTVTKKTEVVGTYRYCVAGQMFTSETSVADAKLRLPECKEQANRGGTVLTCKGAELVFGGPTLRLTWIETL